MNTKTATIAKSARTVKASAATVTPTSPRKGKKVLTEKDFPFPTDAEMRKEDEADIRKIAATTGAKRIATIEQEDRAAKRESAGLAKGVNTREHPHSAKALRDGRSAAKAANKPDKVAAKAEKAVARKAERAAKAAPKADDNRKITIVDKKFTFGRPESARNLSWIACTKSKTVAEYAANGGALKYLPRWVSAGAIKLG